jgi:hypothetical protein
MSQVPPPATTALILGLAIAAESATTGAYSIATPPCGAALPHQSRSTGATLTAPRAPTSAQRIKYHDPAATGATPLPGRSDKATMYCPPITAGSSRRIARRRAADPELKNSSFGRDRPSRGAKFQTETLPRLHAEGRAASSSGSKRASLAPSMRLPAMRTVRLGGRVGQFF